MSSESLAQQTQVYMRIRPQVFDNSGHDQRGCSVHKALDTWDDTSVTISSQYMFSKGANTYKYPKRVFGDQATQDDVFDAVMPELVNEFTAVGGRNCLLIAYGQTGTGKTHTIFGPKDSLSGGDITMWGVFPRGVAAILDKINSQKDTTSKLYLQDIEFQIFGCLDLLDTQKKQVIFNMRTGLFESTRKEVTCIDDQVFWTTFRPTFSTFLGEKDPFLPLANHPISSKECPQLGIPSPSEYAS